MEEQNGYGVSGVGCGVKEEAVSHPRAAVSGQRAAEEKIYRGFRDVRGQAVVMVRWTKRNGVTETYPLKHLVRHSPAGMNWGYWGDPVLDLAWSLCMDLLGLTSTGILDSDRAYGAVAEMLAEFGREWTLRGDDLQEIIDQTINNHGTDAYPVAGCRVKKEPNPPSQGYGAARGAEGPEVWEARARKNGDRVSGIGYREEEDNHPQIAQITPRNTIAMAEGRI